MMHPKTRLQFISAEKGNGVVATEFIPKGTIVWALDSLDLRLSETELQAKGDQFVAFFDTYAFTDADGSWVLCWDHARFINHSDSPNTLSTPYDFDLAVSDIQAGEEITADYGQLFVSDGFAENFNSAVGGRGINRDDAERLHEHWDSLLIGAYRALSTVPQPLANVLPQETLALALSISRGTLTPLSTNTPLQRLKNLTEGGE